MNHSQHNPTAGTPEEIAQLELARLVRMNDKLQKKLDPSFTIDPDVVRMISEMSCAIFTFCSHCETKVDSSLFLTEARRLHEVNELLESLPHIDRTLVAAITDNDDMIARLLNECPIQCLKDENNDR